MSLIERKHKRNYDITNYTPFNLIYNNKSESSDDSYEIGSEIYELINDKSQKIIQKNVYNDKKYLFTELVCNLITNNLILQNIHYSFLLLYDFEIKKDINNKQKLKLLLETADEALNNFFDFNNDFIIQNSFLLQLLTAISAFTKHNIIHNDLFPRNILLLKTSDNFFEYKLLDKFIKIPIYEKIACICDFGKSILDVKLKKNNKKRFNKIKHKQLIDLQLCDKYYKDISIYKKDTICILLSFINYSKNNDIVNKTKKILNKFENYKIKNAKDLDNFIYDNLDIII
jgi:hypothetical protein